MPTIVLGTDLSDNARGAARWASELASLVDTEGDPARLIVAHVIGKDDLQLRQVISNHSEKKERQELRGRVRDWLDDIDSGDTDFEITINVGRKARTLSQIVEHRDADWLVVGKSGRGRLAKLFVGSTAEHLAMRPPCPMLVADPDDEPFGEALRVLSAFDLTESAADAFALGADLVCHHDLDSKITLLHVISIPHGASPIIEGPNALPETLEAHLDESTRWAREEIDELLDDIDYSLDEITPAIEIRPGYPIHEILDTADEIDADLLTLGSKGRSRLAEFMLGGIGRSVLKRAPCSVLLAPPVRKSSGDEPASDFDG